MKVGIEHPLKLIYYIIHPLSFVASYAAGLHGMVRNLALDLKLVR